MLWTRTVIRNGGITKLLCRPHGYAPPRIAKPAAEIGRCELASEGPLVMHASRASRSPAAPAPYNAAKVPPPWLWTLPSPLAAALAAPAAAAMSMFGGEGLPPVPKGPRLPLRGGNWAAKVEHGISDELADGGASIPAAAVATLDALRCSGRCGGCSQDGGRGDPAASADGPSPAPPFAHPTSASPMPRNGSPNC